MFKTNLFLVVPALCFVQALRREWRLLFIAGAQASHCGGFSCCRAQAPGLVGSVAGTLRLRGSWAGSRDSQALGRGPVVAAHQISCSLLHSMWDLSGAGIEIMSPAMAGRFLSTVPPGKSLLFNF